MAAPTWGAAAALQIENATTDCSAADAAAQYLRPYQRDVVARLDATVTWGTRRPLLVAPTGAGKTVVAVAIIKATLDRGERVLFICHRRELVKQAHEKLYTQGGIDAGIIQAGFEPRPGQPVQVASVQTLWARAYRGTRMEKPLADLVVVDEAHHVRARTWTEILRSYADAIVLGMTATPSEAMAAGSATSSTRSLSAPRCPS